MIIITAKLNNRKRKWELLSSKSLNLWTDRVTEYMKRKTKTTAGWFVIINPAAGGGRPYRRLSHLRSWLEGQLSFPHIAMTSAPGHAILLAKQAVSDGFRRLLAVGGDGTCHEMVNGVLQQTEVPSTEITLGLFPMGTGNDWIRNYGIPRRAAAWMQMLQYGNTTVQDVGQLSYINKEGQQASRYFFNVAGIGLAAFTVKTLQEQRLPGWLPGMYLIRLLQSLLVYRSPASKICLGERTLEDRFIAIEAGIGAYAGGGLHLLPQADPADGQLAVMVAHHTSRRDILLNIWRFFNGSIGAHPKVELHQAGILSIECLEEAPLFVEADGEYLGRAPLKIGIIPGAVRFLVPKSSHFSFETKHSTDE
jgi:diacylglycerol kinase (ATP)